MKFLALVAAALVAAVSATPAAAETYWLDTYEPANDGYAGPVVTSSLLKHRRYVLTLSGTFSVYTAKLWRLGKICGKPERQPRFPSRGQRRGPVGADAQWVFADRLGLCRQRPGSVAPWTATQLAVGPTYARVGTLLASYSDGLRANHAYRYAVVGAGMPARIRIKDPNTRDNYGRLRVAIRLAGEADCDSGNFASFGFTDQAQCAADITKPVAATAATR